MPLNSPSRLALIGGLTVISAWALLVAIVLTEAIRPPAALVPLLAPFAWAVPVLSPLWLLSWWGARAIRNKEADARAGALLIPLLVCLPLVFVGFWVGFVVAWLSQCIDAPTC